MTSAAITSGRARARRGAPSTHELGRSRTGERCGDGSGGGGLTLEQLLDGVWEGLHADGAAECPVCRKLMYADDVGGACGDCGSRLA